jgi:hypothetical protein
MRVDSVGSGPWPATAVPTINGVAKGESGESSV